MQTEETTEEQGAEVVSHEKVTKARAKKAAKGKKGKATKGKAPKAKKEKKPKPAINCTCGCGQLTKGGFWLPGHDATLSGAMKNLISGKPLFEGQRDQIKDAVKAFHKGEPGLQTDYFKKLIPKAEKALAA